MAKSLYPGNIDLQMFADGGEGDPQAKGGFSAAYVQELRDEAVAWRKKLRTAEEERDDYKSKLDTANKKSTDLEGQNKTLLESVAGALGLDAAKVKPEEIPGKIKDAISSNNAAVDKAQEALRKSAFIAAAVKQGVRKEALEDAYKLADFSAVKVDLESMSVFPVDKDGNQIIGEDKNPVTGLDSLVGALAKDKPYLVGKVGGVGSSSNPGAGSQGSGDADSFGAELGKKQKEQSKKHSESQNIYFG